MLDRIIEEVAVFPPFGKSPSRLSIGQFPRSFLRMMMRCTVSYDFAQIDSVVHEVSEPATQNQHIITSYCTKGMYRINSGPLFVSQL